MQTQEIMPEASEWLGAMLTFSCHSSHFALPVESVHYISHDANTSCTVHGGIKESQPFIEFDGQPIPIYSFSRIIGQKSNTEIYGQLISALTERREQYVAWLDNIEHCIRNSNLFNKSNASQSGDFSHWYSAYKTNDERITEVLATFEEPHKSFMASTEQAIDTASNGDKDAALTLLQSIRETALNNILTLFSSASERIEALIRPIAVILESNNNLFALELDEISDIVEFSNSDRINDSFSEQHKINEYPIASGLLKQKDSPLYLILTPHKILEYVHSSEFLNA